MGVIESQTKDDVLFFLAKYHTETTYLRLFAGMVKTSYTNVNSGHPLFPTTVITLLYLFHVTNIY